MKSKQDIKKLKYPLWYNIVFAILTIVIPLGLFVYECLSAAHTQAGVVFKVSFVSIVIAIIAWLFVNHFVIKKYKAKILTRQTQLEHDYSAEIGNAEALKTMWYSNERLLTLFEVITVILYGGLGALIIVAIQTSLIKVRGILIIIATCYVLAYTIKYMLLISRKEASDETNDRTKESETNKVDDTQANK